MEVKRWILDAMIIDNRTIVGPLRSPSLQRVAKRQTAIQKNNAIGFSCLHFD